MWAMTYGILFFSCHWVGVSVPSRASLNIMSVLCMYCACDLVRYQKLFSFQKLTWVGSWNAHLQSVLGVELSSIPHGASTLRISCMVHCLSLRCSMASWALKTHTELSSNGRLSSRFAMMSQFTRSIDSNHSGLENPQHRSIFLRLFSSARLVASL